MQLISKFDKITYCFLGFIDVVSKYAWVIPLKGKKGTTIAYVFQKTFDGSGYKPNILLVD